MEHWSAEHRSRLTASWALWPAPSNGLPDE
jgi:hypothetical protein